MPDPYQSTGRPSSPEQEGDAGRVLFSLSRFCAWAAVLWLAFFVIWWGLPATRVGHKQIFDAKLDVVARGDLFPPGSQTKLVVFGDSKVMAGFKPDLFDRLSEGRIASYNLGLPGVNRFVEELATLVRRDMAPDHIILTRPWATQSGKTGWDLLRDDTWVVKTMFPFHEVLRDLTLFSLRSIHNGGPLEHYKASRRIVAQAREARGYYFIEGMSHFPGHRLPASFRLGSDDPDARPARDYEATGPIFERLLELAASAEIRVLLGPTYYREGQYAEPEHTAASSATQWVHGIERVGPDYLLLPNRLFSDPAHVNVEGADCYTRLLWQAYEPVLRADAPVADTPSYDAAALAGCG